MNVFKNFIGILTVNFTFSEDALKEVFFDVLKWFLPYILIPYSGLFILLYVIHIRACTHTHNFLLNNSPFLLESLNDFVFLLRPLDIIKQHLHCIISWSTPKRKGKKDLPHRNRQMVRYALWTLTWEEGLRTAENANCALDTSAFIAHRLIVSMLRTSGLSSWLQLRWGWRQKCEDW